MMTTASATTRQLLIRSTATTFESISSFTKPPPPTFISLLTKRKINRNSIIIPQVSSNNTNNNNNHMKETIFFDGGAHYGDLVANLLLGFTLVWLPLTLAAVLRGFFLRYRFTNLRVTVISGLTGQDRSDFSYKVIKDVQVVPRFIGEWGDVIITLKDGTKIDLRSVPKFREIANYCLSAITTKSSTDDDDQLLELEQAKGF